MKRSISKIVYIIASLIMVTGQLGITQAFAETVGKDNLPKQETKVYHDYEEYQQASKEYDKAYAQYEKDLDNYNQEKQEFDDAQAEADRVEQENADKKAEYEKNLEDYQKALDEYNKKKDEVDDHSSKGQYVGPEMWGIFAQLETYLTSYAAMNQMVDSGMSLSGSNLIEKTKANMAADPFTGSSVVQNNVQTVVDQWNTYAKFQNSIYGIYASTNSIDTVVKYAIGGAWYDGYKGVEFFHTFSSSTGATQDNVPTILDHPTEENIKQALTDLFIQTKGDAFDAANQQMDKDKFLVDQGMVNKWYSALDEAKSQGFDLYTKAIEQYIDAFNIYNSSNYETADYNTFIDSVTAAGETQKTAFDLIGGTNAQGAELEDGDNSAPFYNDLENLSASDLANKYGYLKLMSNMASEATYGYFHLLEPQAGEVIAVATASSWSNSYRLLGPSKGEYTPTLTPPTEPTPPMYGIVPNVPDEPVPPIPPVKPVYEPLNKISLLKVDKDTDEPLPNAEFELVNSDSGEKIGVYKSGSDGLIEITNIDPGNYALTEIKAPQGYILDNTPISFIVHGSENEKIRLEKKNTPVTGSVELTKTDEKTKDVLQGAVFEIRDSGGNVVRSGLQTNLDGKILVDGLKAGEYSFIETKAPTGYVLDNTPIKFTIKKDQKEVVTVSATNKLMPGGVVLSKKDAKDGAALRGAVFELQDKDGKVLQSGLTTNNSGKLAVEGLEPGDYQFVETQAPTGYDLDTTPVIFAIEKGQKEAVQVSMTNKLTPGGVVLSKTDAESGEVLQGAVFELQDKTGKVLQSGLKTDESGKLAVDGLEPGDYQFVETQAPTGYELDKTPVTFTIEKEQKEAVQVSMTNKLTPGGVVLSKTDAKSGEVLQGAVFELQDKEGKVLQSGLKTDESGKLAVDGLEPGDYQLVETQAPTGYELDKTPVTFTIEKGQKEAVQVSMTNKLTPGGVVLSKTDAKTGEVLQGAVFELQDKEGKVLQSGLKTDESGKLAVNGLEPGDYQFVETQAPTGYELSKTPVTFTIEKGQKEAVQVSMTNKLASGDVVLTKTDSKTGEVLQGAVFELQDKEGKVLQSGLKTDESGKLAVEGLEPSDYQFAETQAPTGYELDKTSVTFTIEKGQKEAVQVSMTNKLASGDVVLTKTDSKTGEVLQGAVFELQDKAGKVLQSGLKTDESGKLAVEGLEPSDYQFVETQAPTGYDLDKTPVTFTIEKGQKEAVQVSMTNKPTAGSVVLNKIDSETGEKLAGAVFELKDSKGNDILDNLKTDSNGKLAINNLDPGKYQLIETQAPDGFILDNTPIEFVIKSNTSIQKEVTKVNSEKTKSVRLEKRDSRTNELLQGAKFKLLDSQGKALKEDLTTDSNGVVSIDGLKEGKYQLVETQAPTGYILEDNAINFSVDKDSSLIKLTKLNTQKNNSSNSEKSKNLSSSDYSKNTYSPKAYPKTGEKNSIWLAVLGIIIIVMIAGIWFVKRRR